MFWESPVVGGGLKITEGDNTGERKRMGKKMCQNSREAFQARFYNLKECMQLSLMRHKRMVNL